MSEEKEKKSLNKQPSKSDRQAKGLISDLRNTIQNLKNALVKDVRQVKNIVERGAENLADDVVNLRMRQKKKVTKARARDRSSLRSSHTHDNMKTVVIRNDQVKLRSKNLYSLCDEVLTSTSFSAFFIDAINPANPGVFLSRYIEACDKQEYSLEKMQIELTSFRTAYNSSGNAGVVWAGWIYDFRSDLPTDFTSAAKLGLKPLDLTKDTENYSFPLDVSRCLGKSGPYLCSLSPPTIIPYVQLYSPAKFCICTSGFANATETASLAYIRCALSFGGLTAPLVGTDYGFRNSTSDFGTFSDTNYHPFVPRYDSLDQTTVICKQTMPNLSQAIPPFYVDAGAFGTSHTGGYDGIIWKISQFQQAGQNYAVDINVRMSLFNYNGGTVAPSSSITINVIHNSGLLSPKICFVDADSPTVSVKNFTSATALSTSESITVYRTIRLYINSGDASSLDYLTCFISASGVSANLSTTTNQFDTSFVWRINSVPPKVWALGSSTKRTGIVTQTDEKEEKTSSTSSVSLASTSSARSDSSRIDVPVTSPKDGWSVVRKF
jgi:hypothetical protein